jgi:hypothetical protein
MALAACRHRNARDGATGGIAMSTEDFAANLDLFPLSPLLLLTVLRTT